MWILETQRDKELEKQSELKSPSVRYETRTCILFSKYFSWNRYSFLLFSTVSARRTLWNPGCSKSHYSSFIPATTFIDTHINQVNKGESTLHKLMSWDSLCESWGSVYTSSCDPEAWYLIYIKKNLLNNCSHQNTQTSKNQSGFLDSNQELPENRKSFIQHAQRLLWWHCKGKLSENMCHIDNKQSFSDTP